MSFLNISGNIASKKYLLSIIETNRIPHSILFVGSEGSATLPLAIAFIKYLKCSGITSLNYTNTLFNDHTQSMLNKDSQGFSNDCCNKCSSCRRIDNLVHPDIHFIFPIAKISQIKNKKMISSSLIKEWRKFILENPYGTLQDWSEYINSEAKLFSIYREESQEISRALSLSHFGEGHRFVLIWLPEYMNNSTANAMLKILEEPPSNTIFILVSNNIEKIPITVLSRMQCHYIKPFTNAEVISELCNKYSISSSQAHMIATMVHGNMNEALKISNPNYLNEDFENFKNWMRRCYSKKFDELIIQAEEFSKQSKELQKLFCSYCIKMMRNTLLELYNVKSLIDISEKELIFLQKMSKYFNIKKISFMIKELESLIIKIERNVNTKINFLDISRKFSKIF